MEKIFFDNSESILRTLIITVLAYIALIAFLRVSGKRTLSKMNAFDFIVTIALGSTLATVMLNKSIPLLDGIFALFLLIALQYVITYLSARFQSVSNLVKSTPALLVYKGHMFKEQMKKERIDEDEIYSVIRQKGYSSLEEAGAIILETDGSLTVVTNSVNANSPVISKVIKPDAFSAK